MKRVSCRLQVLEALGFARVLPLAGVVILLAGSWGESAAPAPVEDGKVHFNRDIRPILADNCYQCHGPDEKKRAGKLRLDTKEGAYAALKNGKHPIVPGKSGESRVIARAIATDPEERMPPPDSGKKLTAKQIDLLKKWIDQGAEFQGHWAFLKPERSALPAVKNQAWVNNAIDRFILARLEAEGLKPSVPADKITLIRRVTFDLTGLPPTVAEIEAFLADNAPNAYEKVVDRLLASPRFGEHMARYWLDLARYGDTHGLHFDNERALWKYRDWVISAYNQNKPFNQFAVEQLAGDLLPNATFDQRIATGFNRCNVTTNEGGSINDEVLVRYAVDRTETMATVFMGLTLGCAVCHDHKFDPVSQREFYRLYAFFNAAADAAMDGNTIAPPPVLRTPTPEQEAKLKEIDAKLAEAKKKIAEALIKVEYTDPGPGEPPPKAEPREIVWIDDEPPPGANLQGTTPWEWVTAPHPVHSGKKATRRSAADLSQHFFDGANPGLPVGPGDKLFAHVWIDPKNPPKTIMLQFNDGSWEHRAYWGEDAIPWGTSGGTSRLPMGPLPKPGEWVRLEVDAAKVGLKGGNTLNGWAFTQHGGTVYWDKAGIVSKSSPAAQNFDSLAAWEEVEKKNQKSKVPPAVREVITKVAADKRNDSQKKTLQDYFVENVYPKTRPIFEPLHKEIAGLEKSRKDTDATIPMTMVMADLPTPRETHVLIRGQYDKKGDKVTAGTPAALPPFPTDAPSNRLGLARWLTDPAHPLTARVAVNRYWQQYFGRGLVKTAEDFGSQGEWPSHPELLDYLAVEFAESGWNIKQFQKLIVMSSAYRQASAVSPELLKRDPENILIARGPRFRLDGEIVRDSALFAGGLLVEQVGGRSVKPYQPPGIWEPIGFNGSDTREYKRGSGADLYRRSLYTFWKRTAPPPSLMAFDAPSREACVARRSRTNTPLQALALMNDEQYVEAARMLAERMMTQGGGGPAERLAHGFRVATGRKPSDKEAGVLVNVFQRQLEHYKTQPDAAKKLLAIGDTKRNESLDAPEHAAYTMVANLILNLDETITKE